MINKYTEEDIDSLFRKFKQLPDYYGMEKVYQLINNPDARARFSGKPFIKPLNFIFMATFVITSIVVITFGLSTFREVKDQTLPVTNIGFQAKSDQIVQALEQIPLLSKSTNPKVSEKKNPVTVFSQQNPVNPIENGMNGTPAEPGLLPTIPVDCPSPEDTLLDKTRLFVHLDEPERERVGLFYMVDSTKKPVMERYAKIYRDGIGIWVGSKRKTGSYISGFNVCYTSDTACTNHRWNSPFYNSIDTLIPVVHLNKIYWFYAVPGVFDSLPPRFQHLKETYASLKCLKKKYPDRQLVNYWNKKMILGDIKLISLTKEELENIGIVFNKEGNGYSIVNPQTKKAFYSYYQDKNTAWGTQSKDTTTRDYIPILKTDEKGLNQHFYMTSKNKQNIATIAEVLIPVKIPLNEYMKDIPYYDVYWYNPTDSFISLLPERIRYTLKAEKESILKNSKIASSSGCIYFEACQSTLELDNLSVFPNPATQYVTLQFSTRQDINGYISLSNMAGVPIKQLTTNSLIRAGHNSFKLDLSGIRSGMYLLTVFSDKGFKTKRLIVM